MLYNLIMGLVDKIHDENYKTNAYKEYNQHCAKPATLSMGVTGNGFGLCLTF